MQARCIVGGCSNTTKDGASLHLFPKDANLRRIWVSKVKLTRANWSGPSDWSVVCSSHFEDADFDDGLHAAFGMKRTRRLKPEAVPKIRSETSMQVKRSGSRTAADKRKKMRMLDELLSTSVEARDAEEQGSAVEPASMESQSDTDEPGCSQWTDEHSSESEESFDEQV
ncbi:THAP domain-containing protein 10-like [Lytechinus variegatus]|uniref:THAP domain-containing protein 10-like n=1 Tax=Lytechinus variegatus TaxID=7654 RepID=UPI001BB1CD84|nr:THAP domain-containing protein 10-like [Lytechinus variegatus]